ncbi:MAG: hypothetical protein LKI42_03550 [Bacteroidales bacterium]|jgi:hypothetical protein|nr:hypothetical protein [Bacteroidales bacterium]MCI1784651.1 hypothetical protein [Bacteroidales bacterium]
MKKLIKGSIGVFAIIVTAIIVYSCDLGESAIRTSYVLGYYKLNSVIADTASVSIGGKNYYKVAIGMDNTAEPVASIYDSDRSLFDYYCSIHNDMLYPKAKIYSDLTNGISFPIHDFTKVEVVCKGQWDEEHPAGSCLNDIIHFVSVSPYPYIMAGYKGFDYGKHTMSAYFNNVYPFQTNYGVLVIYPVDKPLSEVTKEDLILSGTGEMDWPEFCNLFIAKRTGTKGVSPCGIEIRMTDDAGKIFSVNTELD